jgi:hypothetical protein
MSFTATTMKEVDIQAVCKQCQIRITSKKQHTKTNCLMTPLLFNLKIMKYIKRLAREKKSIEEIKHYLINQFPKYEMYITTSTISSLLKAELKLFKKVKQQQEKVDIENDDSIFIGEENIALKSIDNITIQTFIMCAISSKGLIKMDICVGERQCGHYFTKLVLNQLKKKKSYQIIVKSSMPDLIEIKKLFPRYSLHTLFYLPVLSSTNPVRKYIRKLAESIPKNIRIKDFEQLQLLFKHAEQQVTKRDCKRWIDRYLELSGYTGVSDCLI